MRPGLRSVAAQMEQLVDPVIGIIAAVHAEPQMPGEPAFTQVTARLADITRLFPVAGFSPMAAGTALDPQEAWVRACGEALERYAGFIAAPGPYAPASALPIRSLPPDQWPACSAEEYKRNGLAAPDPGRPYHWLRGWSVTSREHIFLPAMHVLLGYWPDHPAELVSLPHSTGLAAGGTLESATLSGLCEVLERDAFLLTWSKRLPAPRLQLSSWADQPELSERINRVRRAGLDLRLHALLPETPPVKMLALIYDREDGLAPVATGLGASTSPYRAAAKAIDEAVQSRRSMLESRVSGEELPIPDAPDAVQSLPDHLAYYLKPERLEAFRFLDGQPEVTPGELPSLADKEDAPALQELVNQLEVQGYEVLRADLTGPDLAEAGFRVVRVMVPGTLPLAHGHWTRFLASPRWNRFPGEISPWPHPFG